MWMQSKSLKFSWGCDCCEEVSCLRLPGIDINRDARCHQFQVPGRFPILRANLSRLLVGGPSSSGISAIEIIVR